jgi:hypothetical protein
VALDWHPGECMTMASRVVALLLLQLATAAAAAAAASDGLSFTRGQAAVLRVEVNTTTGAVQYSVAVAGSVWLLGAPRSRVHCNAVWYTTAPDGSGGTQPLRLLNASIHRCAHQSSIYLTLGLALSYLFYVQHTGRPLRLHRRAEPHVGRSRLPVADQLRVPDRRGCLCLLAGLPHWMR